MVFCWLILPTAGVKGPLSFYNQTPQYNDLLAKSHLVVDFALLSLHGKPYLKLFDTASMLSLATTNDGLLTLADGTQHDLWGSSIILKAPLGYQ